MFVTPLEETLDICNVFVPLLDYGNLLFMNLCGQYLKRLDTIYHCAVCFTAGHGNLAHQSSLYTGAK